MMLQIGTYLSRGEGAVVLHGSTGIALVPENLAPGAHQAVNGQVDIGTWLHEAASSGADFALIDTTGPTSYLTTRGRASATLHPAGGGPAVEREHLWGEIVRPEALDAIVLRVPGTDGDSWQNVSASGVRANEVCVGALPASLRGAPEPGAFAAPPSPAEAFGAPVPPMNRFHPTGAAPSTPAFGTPAPSGAPESAASSAADARPSAAAAAHGSVFGATIPDSEEPGAGSSSAVSPSAPSAAFGAPVGQAPTSGTGSAGPIPADSAPHDFARPHTPVERQSVESRQSAFRPVSIQPVAAAQPPAPGAVPPAHAAPVEPFAPAPLASSRASATATGTPIDAGPSRAESASSTQSGPIPTAANPLHLHSRAEAAQARVAAEAEASSPAWGEPARQAPSQAWGTPPPPPPAQRVPSDLWAQEHSAPQQTPAHANPAFGSAGPSDSYAPGEGDANSVLPRRRSAAEAPRVAFLVHAGSAPVELDRDVVIGRDPNTHVLTGRTQATPLRVPSPATEISRSHCAVISTGPSAWALMDLGSANGTLLRRGNGTMEDVIPMTTVPLSDGDLIDVGEGTTIEFRVR